MKRRMLKMTATISSLLLLLSFVLMPMVAGALPDITVPTPNGAAYSTSYEDGVYTVDLDAAFLTDLLKNGQLTKENLKEHLPEKLYNLIAEQDAESVKSLLLDLIDKAYEAKENPSEAKDVLIRVLKKAIRKVLDTEKGSALVDRVKDQVGLASYEAAAEIPAGFDFSSLLDEIPDDLVINAENLNTLLDLANQMIDSGVVTVEDVKKVVPEEKLTQILKDNGANIAEGTTVKIEDVLKGDHNDDIVKATENGVTAKDYKENVIDKEELAKIEISYEALIKNILETLKDRIISVVSRIEAVRVNDVTVFNDAQLDLGAAEQAIINAIPTMDEIVKNLAAEGEYAEILNLSVMIAETDPDAPIRSYKLQVRFAGSKEDRATLATYAEKVAKFVSYTYNENGDLTLKLTLPEGFLPVVVSSIDETKLPASLKTALGNVAELDFSDRANSGVIVDAIINNFTLNNYADLIDAFDINSVDVDLFDAFKNRTGLTNDHFETARSYLVRAIDKAYSLADKYSKYGLDKIVDKMDAHKLSEVNYAGNGVFSIEGNFSVDVLELVQKAYDKVDNRFNDNFNDKFNRDIPEIPDYILDSLTNTTFTHSLTVEVEFDSLVKVDYVEGGEVTESEYAFAGDALKEGWANADLTKVVPETDTKVAKVYTATFNRYWVVGENKTLADTKVFEYNELSDTSAIKPTELAPKKGYGEWTWDYDWATEGFPMDKDIVINGTSTAIEYTINVGYTVKDVWNPLGTYVFTVEDYADVVADINALELPAVKGYTTPDGWDVELPADFDAAVAAIGDAEALTVNATYEAIEYTINVGYTVKDAWTDLETFKFTIENYAEIVEKINALELPAVKGYTTPDGWDVELPADFDAAVAAIGDGEALKVNATYVAIEYTINLDYKSESGKTVADSVEITFTVEDDYAEKVFAAIKFANVKYYTAPTVWDADVPADFDEAVAAMKGNALTLTAEYTAIEYTINLDYKSESGIVVAAPVEITFTVEDDYAEDVFAAIKFADVDYYTAPTAWDAEVPANFKDAVAAMEGNALTLTAEYTAIEYTINLVYKSESGIVVAAPVEITFTVEDDYVEDVFAAVKFADVDYYTAPTAWDADVPANFKDALAAMEGNALTLTAKYAAIKYTVNATYTVGDKKETIANDITFTVEDDFSKVVEKINALLANLNAVNGYKTPTAWDKALPADFDAAVAAMGDGTVLEVNATYTWAEHTVNIGGTDYKFNANTDLYALLNGLNDKFARPGFKVEWYAVITSASSGTSAVTTAPAGGVKVTEGYKLDPSTIESVEFVPVLVANTYTVEFKYDGKTHTATFSGADAYADGNPDNDFDAALLKTKILNLAPDAAKKAYTYEWNVPAITEATLADTAVAVVVEANYTAVVYTAEFGYELDGKWVSYKTVEFTIENFAEVFGADKLPAFPEIEGYEVTKWNVPATFDEAFDLLVDGKLTIKATLKVVEDIPPVTQPTEPDTDPITESGTETTGTDGKGGFPWWIIIIILVVILLVLILIFVIRKNNEEEPTEEPEDEVATEFEDEAAEDMAPIIVDGEELAILDSVSADIVDGMMSDATAKTLVVPVAEAGGAGKMGVINVGTVSENFEAGETVDLEALKAKGLINDNAGRLKILAAGTLNKPLIFKADAFSVQAIKMITLTGGHAIKLGATEAEIEAAAAAAEAAMAALVAEAPAEAEAVVETPAEAEAVAEPEVEAAPEVEAEVAPEAEAEVEAEAAPEAEEPAAEAEAETAPEAEEPVAEAEAEAAPEAEDTADAE